MTKQTSNITKLTQELSTEIDDHAESEQELRRLEEECETLSLKLDKQGIENKALTDNIASSEEDIAHYQKLSQSINQSPKGFMN
jgi:chromosome segregation ATPase